MATEAPAQGLIKFSSGRHVEPTRMQREGRMFSLYDATNMDIETFNKKATTYGVHMNEIDTPAERMAKYAVFLSRMGKDNLAITSNSEYIAIVIEAAAKKASEPFASFYHMLTNDAVDFVGEVLAFKEQLRTGANKDKYVAERKVFDGDAVLENKGDILVAPQGWQRVLGPSGYPVETSSDACRIESIEIPGLEDNDASGFWHIGEDPVGQERIVLRDPFWNDDGLLSAYVDRGRSYSSENVGALRSRGVEPEYYKNEIDSLRAQVKNLFSRWCISTKA